MSESGHAKVIPFSQEKKKPSEKTESKKNKRPVTKLDKLNLNKKGSVRNIGGKVWVDFRYLGERVREPAGLVWNEENAKTVRSQLDRVFLAIESGEFKFAKVFSESSKAQYFSEKERHSSGGAKEPDQLVFKDYARDWYEVLRGSGRITGRTLHGYKSQIDQYLLPYFGEMTFSALNKLTFERFIGWAREQKFRKRTISNSTVNKIFVPLKMICHDAAVEYRWGWGFTYNPFEEFKKLQEDDAYEKIRPFSPEEQKGLIEALPEHWRPFFMFAFRAGLRTGEQMAVMPDDINWKDRALSIRRGFTRDEDGKFLVGRTKNRYSRRTLNLSSAMMKPLEAQKKIWERFNSEYFFCSPEGHRINLEHLRTRVWIPALRKSKLEIREIKQTRHSFATNALISSESPTWIAKFMGHRNTEMIIKHYIKHVENAGSSKDGSNFDRLYQNADE